MTDKLQALNDELRASGNLDAGPWLPLESNPDVLTSFARRVGLPSTLEFVDVLGLDPELLAMTPRPCAAAILLFPCTPAIYAFRATESRELRSKAPTPSSSSSFHITQVASFGNACGTIACMHVLTNLPSLTPGPVSSYKESNLSKPSTLRGAALLTDPSLRLASDAAAEHALAQTSCPSRDGPDLDHHYCAFVPVLDGASGREHVVELDGTKDGPVDHGEVRAFGEDFLEAVASVVKARWMSLEPGRLDFSLMALCEC